MGTQLKCGGSYNQYSFNTALVVLKDFGVTICITFLCMSEGSPACLRSELKPGHGNKYGLCG